MTEKKMLAVLCGSQSAEHVVSISSARFVVQSIDCTKYHVALFYIDKQGRWFWVRSPEAFFSEKSLDKKIISGNAHQVAWIFGPQSSLQTIHEKPTHFSPDVVFPCCHGPYGEDGTLQGLLAMANVPCVGSGVLGSAVNMDKDICKRLLQVANIPVAPWICQYAGQPVADYEEVSKLLGDQLFIKAANLGSSVGVYAADNQATYKEAMAEVFHYDSKVLIEQSIPMKKELECAVFIGHTVDATLAGELSVDKGFYDYDAKYIHADRMTFHVPADLTESQQSSVGELAKKAALTTDCQGLARVDMFLLENDTLIVNEVNTLPGLTPISFYPKLWALAGKSPADLLHELIVEAEQRHARKQALLKEPAQSVALAF